MTLLVAGGHVLRPDTTVERGDVRVDDEGRIAAVGDLTRRETDQRLDATDALVTPGFVNAHGHAAMTLLRGYADDKPLDAWLEEDIWPAEAELDRADIAAGARLACAEMIRSGTTGFADMYFEVEALVEAVAAAGLRARVGYGVVTAGTDAAGVRAELERAAAVAERFDGAADGRVRAAVMPHAPHTVDRESLAALAETAREADVPVHFHFNETPTYAEAIVEEAGERPGPYADGLGLFEDAWVAHAVHLDDAEVDLLADRDVAVAHCPAANMKLASGIAPVERLRAAGVTVGLGTDGAASNNSLDMVAAMRDAALSGKTAAEDASAVPAPAVVEMATAGGAAATRLPGGRIEAGAPADLAVVDTTGPHLTPAHDLVSHLVYAARGSDVRHTICDGEVLMRDRELLTLDEARVRREAEERAGALVDRAG